MAQKFIIDGNFTQSFQNINLTLAACPADFDYRPPVHYDIDSGDLCYLYDPRVCFDYVFDTETFITFTSSVDSTIHLGPKADRGRL